MSKPKIVITQQLDFCPGQLEKLREIGDVVEYTDYPEDYDAWLDRVQGADIICSGKFGLKQNWQKLKDVFIALPFVGVGWVDIEKAKERNITFANAPGCNKEPVVEWIIGMMINLMRDLPNRINKEVVDTTSKQSLAGKKVCICGAGNIGAMVGDICEAMHMNVVYVKRGDNIIEKSKDAEVIVDTLPLTKETTGIYNRDFFMGLKKGSYFITVTSDKIWDVDAMLDALDQNILAGVANDCGGIQVDDTRAPLYKKLSNHPKVMATAHTAFNTDRRNEVCNDMMIDNIEAYLKGEPINIVE